MDIKYVFYISLQSFETFAAPITQFCILAPRGRWGKGIVIRSVCITQKLSIGSWSYFPTTWDLPLACSPSKMVWIWVWITYPELWSRVCMFLATTFVMTSLIYLLKQTFLIKFLHDLIKLLTFCQCCSVGLCIIDFSSKTMRPK